MALRPFQSTGPAAVGKAAGGTSPRLLVGLVFSLLAAGWALWWPKADDGRTVAPAPRGTAENKTSGALHQGLAAQVPPSSLSEAVSDPFHPQAGPAGASMPVTASTPTANLTVGQLVTPALAPAPPRVAGSFVGPDGTQSAFLVDGSQWVAAKVGAVLNSGYRVEAVGAQALHLRHPAASEPVVLPMSAASGAGTLP